MSLDIVSSVACGAVRSLFGPQTSPSKYDEAASHLRRTDFGKSRWDDVTPAPYKCKITLLFVINAHKKQNKMGVTRIPQSKNKQTNKTHN